jgi:Ni/Fe-hydrogenase subunit HybB-like protein
MTTDADSRVPGSRTKDLIEPGHTFASITEKISAIVLTRGTPRGWLLAFGVASVLVVVYIASVVHLLTAGIGIWGVQQPVSWGFDIVNLVWWIGIGHAGTLISAILLLLRQKWRTSINRFAEAMTLFAVFCAAQFPLLHLGRPWLAYWIFPYPNTMDVWPQFRSPLVWDLFAISTYATVSFLFWFVGLIPDFATMRDRAGSMFVRRIFGLLAMGWRGSARHWHRYEVAYLLLAGLSTPLVVSVHTVVGLDFAVAVLPGWHATFVPPYFVAGAIFSGFAMVLTLAIPIRKIYELEDFITIRHLDNMAKVILATGLIVAYAYAFEAFFAYYSTNPHEQALMEHRLHGPMSPAYFALIACNVIVPQLLWWKRVRRSVPMLFVIAIVVNVGMWLERYVIVVGSLHRDFLPSSWGMYFPTFWDWSTYLGSMGVFLFLMLLFIRFLPAISMFEMRHMLQHTRHQEEAH